MVSKETIQKNFLSIVVVVLIVILLLQRCGSGDTEPAPGVIIKRDTTWIVKDSTIITKPQLVNTIEVPVERWDVEYLPDTNYANLLKQYIELASKHVAQNVYNDTIKIDSTGWLSIKDTVSKNRLTTRSFEYSFKYPKITETITIPEKKRNQMYVGGMIGGNREQIVNQINAGLLLKTKKDQIFGVNAGINTQGQVVYGLQSYWKIKLW
jgi:hypothetical protein